MNLRPITQEMFLCKLELEDGSQVQLGMGMFRRNRPLGYQAPPDSTWNLQVCMGKVDIDALPNGLGAHVEWDSVGGYMNLIVRDVTLPNRPDDTRIKSAIITYDEATDAFDWTLTHAPEWTPERYSAYMKKRQREFSPHFAGRMYVNA